MILIEIAAFCVIGFTLGWLWAVVITGILIGLSIWCD